MKYFVDAILDHIVDIIPYSLVSNAFLFVLLLLPLFRLTYTQTQRLAFFFKWKMVNGQWKISL